MSENKKRWPSLRLDDWEATYQTLHMYTQVVGKIRLGLSPMMNQWWQVPLYVTARGLTTGPMPAGDRVLELAFDFIDHRLCLTTSDGYTRSFPLGCSVKQFFGDLMAEFAGLGIDCPLWSTPVEVADPVPFERDERREYDKARAFNFFQTLCRVDAVFKAFRSRFTGKCSPVQFYWGSFDLAVTRFSGKTAAPGAEMDRIMRESYNAELCSLGFWPGGNWPGAGRVDSALFYSYTYPRPQGLENEAIAPAGARWEATLGEFVLPYEGARQAPDTAEAVLAFAQSTYEAGARLAAWHRFELEQPGSPAIAFLRETADAEAESAL